MQHAESQVQQFASAGAAKLSSETATAGADWTQLGRVVDQLDVGAYRPQLRWLAVGSPFSFSSFANLLNDG
jgi:hypothetical protein